jgi:outer membrane receptor protein involved in Fe transport
MKSHTAGRGISFRTTLFLGATGLALALPTAAFAQDDDEADGNQIVVTAVKREQTLQDTPVAVTVTTGEAIERAQIRDLKDLQTIVPSLRVTQLQSSANTNFIIRGFGNGANNAGIEPSVGVFVDGVYRSRTAAQINDLPNVSRVEVLRGPQSTLFGKNASAGVISIRTEEPQFDLGGSVEASYGNFDAMVLRGYVTGPLSESVAASVAAGWSQRDGYFKDLGTGDRTNERNRWFVRGQLLFEPSTDLNVRLIADYDSIDENCCGVVNLQRSAATAVVDALGDITDANHPYADVVYSNRNSTNDIENWGVSGEINWDAGPVQLTSITAFRNNSAITSQDPDFSSADLINPIAADVQIDTFTQELRFVSDLTDGVHLLLGAFYIKEDVDQTGELFWGSQARAYADQLVLGLSGGALGLTTGTFPPVTGQTVPLETILGYLDSGNPGKYAGQFFRAGDGNRETFGLDSEAFSIFGQVDFDITDRLTLTLGGNYTKDMKDYSAAIAGNDVFSQINLDAAAYAPFRAQLLDGGYKAQAVGTALGLGRSATNAEIFAFATGASPAGLAGATAYANVITPNAAAYAAANMNNPLANPLNPLRALQYLPQFLAVPNAVEDGHISDDDFSYTLRLAYEISDTFNMYASYATGFKAASVNLSRDSRPLLADKAALTSAGLTKVNQTYGTRFADPENSRVIEVGLKADFGRASANIAVFDQQIKGFQSNIFTGTGFALSNAGKQSTFGVEFEGRAEVADGLGLNLGVTYLDPKYDDYTVSAVGDLSGTRPGGIPTWTVVVGGDYKHEFDNGDSVILSASYHFESDALITEGLPGFLVRGPDGSIVNAAPALAAAAPFTRQVDDLTASISYAMDNGLEFTLWGRNLLDDRYLLQIFDSVAQPLSISGYPNQPRTWGGTVRYKF